MRDLLCTERSERRQRNQKARPGREDSESDCFSSIDRNITCTGRVLGTNSLLISSPRVAI